jgi:hypothetical protein
MFERLHKNYLTILNDFLYDIAYGFFYFSFNVNKIIYTRKNKV